MSKPAPGDVNFGHKDFNNADGSFNRPPSSFRATIEKGSRHEPEKGMPQA